MLLLPPNVQQAAGKYETQEINTCLVVSEAKCIFDSSGGSVYQRTALCNAHEYFAAGWIVFPIPKVGEVH